MNKIVLLLLILPFFGNSQDTHFSSRYAMKEYNNPALASAYKGSEQVSIMYRRQWSSLGSGFPFQSYAVNLNKKLEWDGSNEFSANLRFIKDLAPGKSFTQNHIILAANYKKLLTDRYNEAQFLSIGFSGGLGQNKANWEGLWFGNQYSFEQGNPDFSIESGENVSVLLAKKTFPDLNLGLAYEYYLPKFSMVASLAIHHLTKPDISFVPNLDIRNDRKISANISLNVLMKENLYFIFSPYYSRQGVFHYASGKLGFAFAAADDYDINFGVSIAPSMVQNFEGLGFASLSLQIFIEKNEYRFDLSYDATISKLSAFNGGRGAFEFSFSYTRKNYNPKSSFVRNFHQL